MTINLMQMLLFFFFFSHTNAVTHTLSNYACIPGDKLEVGLKDDLRSSDDREWTWPPMCDEIPVLVMIKVNLSNNVRWQNQVGVPDEANARGGRHVSEVGHVEARNRTEGLNINKPQ